MQLKLLILSLGLSLSSMAQSTSDSLTQKLDSILKTSKFPGFAVSIVTPEKVLYQKGFGYADLEKKVLFTPQTIQNIGSISKTFIGVSLMKLVEEGKVSLDTPINDILPFKVVHPKSPDTPILVRHLATHSAGIADSPIYNVGCYYLTEDNPKLSDQLSKKDLKYIKKISENKYMPMGEFLQNYLTKGGEFYNARNFAGFSPGSQYQYSNVGATLGAYIVEIITGKGFDEYSKGLILQKIPMSASGWHFKEVNMDQHAMLYLANQAPMPKYSLITYPDGGMLTNNEDLSKYLMAMMQGYYGKSSILKPETFQEMMKVQFTSEKETPGVFWSVTKLGNIGHNGADPGVFTVMLFFPDKKYGTLFMTNISAEKDIVESFYGIWNNLKAFGEAWSK